MLQQLYYILLFDPDYSTLQLHKSEGGGFRWFHLEAAECIDLIDTHSQWYYSDKVHWYSYCGVERSVAFANVANMIGLGSFLRFGHNSSKIILVSEYSHGILEISYLIHTERIDLTSHLVMVMLGVPLSIAELFAGLLQTQFKMDLKPPARFYRSP